LVSGDYTFKIQSSANGQELGCLALKGSVSGLVGASSQCTYTSSFSVSLASTDSTLLMSTDYEYIQVGPYGNVPASVNGSRSWGSFKNFVGTSDVGGTVDTDDYVWGINATQMSANSLTDGSYYVRTYEGVMFVGYNDAGVVSTVFTGYMNWTITHDIDASPQTQIVGTFEFAPLYSDSSLFTYPVVLGNLGPFQMTRQSNGQFLVTGSRVWCTCGLDACGVCGGDGSSCLISLSTQSQWSVYTKTAVGVGVGGGVIGLLAVIALFFVLRKTKKRNQRRHDDQDLIDTPEKPDYGTLAIDEVIQEGDRV